MITFPLNSKVFTKYLHIARRGSRNVCAWLLRTWKSILHQLLSGLHLQLASGKEQCSLYNKNTIYLRRGGGKALKRKPNSSAGVENAFKCEIT